MKKLKLLIVSFFLGAISQAQGSYWQTTHLGNSFFHSNGNCRLESNRINITIHPFHLQVEEEAIIRTIGTVWYGDSLTLEIIGEFTLSNGSAVRSMLLWNGNKILKAKLRDKAAADSAYEEVVDRDKPVFVSRDPAIIEYLGNNRYRYKIYPVAINNTRKIRISYTIPLTAYRNLAQFEVFTAFTKGNSEWPKSISVEINKSETSLKKYALSNGTELKPIHFGSTYMIPYTDMPDPNDLYSKKMLIIADYAELDNAYAHNIDTGIARGYYTAVFTALPDTFRQMLTETSIINYTCESQLSVGNKSFVSPLPSSGFFSIYIKSEKQWDGIINWFAYDEDGNSIAQYKQQFLIDSSLPECAELPFLWGTKYCLSEKSGDLGALFGFVDRRMSLLALESDILDTNTSKLYAENGVPFLSKDEIIIDPSQIPASPKENIIVDYTKARTVLKKLTKLMIKLISGNIILIELGEKLDPCLKIELYDLSGRLVYSWKNINVNEKSIRLKIPENFRGTYILRLNSISYSQQQKVILK